MIEHVEKILVKRWGSWLLVPFVYGFFFFCSYNKLFRFLLKVKQTQLDLQQVWAAYMGTKHLSTAQLSNMTKIWLSRMHMAFLVDNLQYYLQVTYLQLKILIKRKFWNLHYTYAWEYLPTNLLCFCWRQVNRLREFEKASLLI